MNATEPSVLVSSAKLPYFGFLPQTAEMRHYGLCGFEIPSLPALAPEDQSAANQLLSDILYRFELYLLELHESNSGRSVALQLMADPERTSFVSQVRIFVLCRSAQNTPEAAQQDALSFAKQAAARFPRGGLFNYGQELWLDQGEISKALFLNTQQPLQITELRKHEEIQGQQGVDNDSLRYVPHRFWADRRRDPWLLLIEGLALCPVATAIRIELTPVRLSRSSGWETVAGALQWFNTIDEDMARKASHGEQIRTDGITTDEMFRSPLVAWARTRPKYVTRGKFAFEQLLNHADRLFAMRVVLASVAPIPEGLIGGARAALLSPPAEDANGNLGWIRPEMVAGASKDAMDNWKWLSQTNWGSGPGKPDLFRQLDLRSIVTSEEAVSLFHLPIYDRPGRTSALSTAETPFVIPPETLSRKRTKPNAHKVRIGHLYQRERLLSPELVGDQAQPFWVTMSDLTKPSLLVGAPGSGKTNLAVSLLIQLWQQKIPFMVLDPSTGQEFRFLIGDKALKEDMVLYTVGDPTGFPLRFNPFSIPPGVTARNHTTYLMAAFKASMTMWDPIPAIFEGALERLYTDEQFCGKGRAMKMEDRGDLSSPAPTLNDFAAALEAQLGETLEQYKGSEQSIGVIRGGSVVRIQSLAKKLGHILNVPGNGGEFFQRMLQRPVVIELGALGDSNNIALLMAFLLGQISGHVEYAYREMGKKGQKREHLILIEEAHRLLAGGEGPQGKSAEDLNTMLAEVRKFGQGIMTLDQRPSSLVGGVLDNAYVKILTRLSDRVGFDRLSNELNLSEAQKRFAHTRLRVGDAILLDRDAGQPVLMRSDNVKDELEDNQLEGEAFRQKIIENATRFDLCSPEQSQFGEQAPKAHSPADSTKPVGASKSSGSTKGQVRQHLFESVQSKLAQFLDQERQALAYEVYSKLNAAAPDVIGAKQSVDQLLEGERKAFAALTESLWEQAKWTYVGDVANKYALKEAAAEVQHNLSAASSVASGDGALAKDWFVAQLDASFLAFLEKERPTLLYNVHAKLNQQEPDVGAAKAAAEAAMVSEKAEFLKLAEQAWQQLQWSAVGVVAETYRNQKAQELIRQARKT